MKRTILALMLIETLAGCASADKVRDWLIDPKTAAAAQVVSAGFKALICGLAEGTSIALSVEQAGSTKGQTVTNMVLVGSAAVCSALGGAAQGTVVTKGGEVVVTAAPAK